MVPLRLMNSGHQIDGAHDSRRAIATLDSVSLTETAVSRRQPDGLIVADGRDEIAGTAQIIAHSDVTVDPIYANRECLTCRQ